MKCLCGYENITDYDEIEERTALDLDFKNGEFLFLRSHLTFIDIHGKSHNLYACPKCGTVKIEIEE